MNSKQKDDCMNIIIVGASKGIGLELCRQYRDQGHAVTALCRKITDDLKKLDVKVIENVDITSFDSLKESASSINDKSIDVFIHNAGMWRTETFTDMNFETIQEQFSVNTLAPMKSVMAFLPKLASSAKIGLMSSRMGSIADNTSGGRYGYRISKCALNMAAKSLSVDLVPSGISLAILHPGFVRTDMTEGKGDLNPDESVAGMIKVMDKLTIESTGRFWHTAGHELPW